MTCEHHVHENAMIDFIQGRYDNEKEKLMEEHFKKCEDCRRKFEIWTGLLQPSPQEHPPSHLKRKIAKAVNRKHKFAKSYNKPALVLAGACIAFLLGLTGYLIHPNLENIGELNEFVYKEGNRLPQPFLIQDETNIYEISPELNNKIKGYVWINNHSNEMMLLIDGLQPISLTDYQAWIQTTDELKNAGIVKMIGEKGQLYMKDNVIDELEHIVVSKEPQGGSDFLTDPNPVLLKLSAQ